MKDVMAGLQQTNSEKILLSWVRQNTRHYPQVCTFTFSFILNPQAVTLDPLLQWFLSTAVCSVLSGNCGPDVMNKSCLLNVNGEHPCLPPFKSNAVKRNEWNNDRMYFLCFIFSGTECSYPCQRPYAFFMLSVYLSDWISQNPHEQIFMKFGGQIGFEPGNNGLGFGGDPDLGLVPSDDYHFIAPKYETKRQTERLEP